MRRCIRFHLDVQSPGWVGFAIFGKERKGKGWFSILRIFMVVLQNEIMFLSLLVELWVFVKVKVKVSCLSVSLYSRDIYICFGSPCASSPNNSSIISHAHLEGKITSINIQIHSKTGVRCWFFWVYAYE